jgi:very-short-patch-repair endonuclease
MSRASKGEVCLAAALAADPLPGWDLTPQYPFDPTRKWTLDFAWPSQKLAVEVEGARHRTFKGQRDDSEKFNEAVRQGWRVLRFPADQVTTSKASAMVALIREILCCPPSSSSACDASE